MCLHYIHPDPTPVLVPRTPCPPASLGQPSPSSQSMLFAQQRQCVVQLLGPCGLGSCMAPSGWPQAVLGKATGKTGRGSTAKQATAIAVRPRAHELWEPAGLTVKEKQMDGPFPGNICVMGRVCHD